MFDDTYRDLEFIDMILFFWLLLCTIVEMCNSIIMYMYVSGTSCSRINFNLSCKHQN